MQKLCKDIIIISIYTCSKDNYMLVFLRLLLVVLLMNCFKSEIPHRKHADFNSRKRSLSRRLLPFKRLILTIEHVYYLSLNNDAI